MTLAGLGISYLPDFFVDDDIAAGRLTSLFADELDDRVGIYALLPGRRQVTAAARAFVDFLIEYGERPTPAPSPAELPLGAR
jgi:DNA-binding transcriptional LysR family regulator